MASLLVALGVVAGSAAAAAPVGAPVDAGLARQHDQLVAIEYFRTVAAAAPDAFAGISTRGPAEVTVHVVDRVQPAAADLDGIRRAAAANGITLSFKREKHSLTDLNRIRAALQDDDSLTSADGTRVGVGVNPDTNSVEVSADVVTPGLTAAGQRFGAAVRVIEQAKPQPVLGRFNDTSPYYGGDRIGNREGTCTYGFSLTNLYGIRYGITAGHCFTDGAGVALTRWFPGTDNSGTGYADFGQVKFRRYANDLLDNELVGSDVQDYGGLVWVDANLRADPAERLPVHSAQNSCIGCQVWVNGSFSGKRLMTINRNPGCVTNSQNVRTCGMWTATPADGGGPACNPGDSGGPVFAYDGRGGIIAVGIISAQGGSTCYFTSVPDILRSWQSTITTG
ncbi:MAG: S1 family peptidase [Saccharothrix sp.]|nr:S1 family peptidase [Saccharothrix sp.]